MDALRLTANRIDGSRVTSRKMTDGHEFLIAPVVMIVEGVLNGELLSEAEFAHHVASWNGRPIVLDHPVQDGMPVSANHPEVLEQVGIGNVFNAEAREGKLRAEAWVDVNRASRSQDGREIVQRLRAGKGIEVSTAYWRDLDGQPGELDGVAYNGIARNLKPDHLAFLVHDVGACSIADGCGCPRVNADGTQEQEGNVITGTTAADPPESSRDGADDGHESGLIQALRRWAGAITNRILEGNMDERRQAILESGETWDAETLAALTEEQIEWLHGHVVQVAPEPATNEADPEPAQAPVDIRALLDEYLADVGGLDGLKARIAEIKTVEANARAEIVARLAANTRCAFTEAQLNKLDQETLEAFERSLRPADYRGQGGGPQANAGGVVVEKLDRPSLFEEVH